MFFEEFNKTFLIFFIVNFSRSKKLISFSYIWCILLPSNSEDSISIHTGVLFKVTQLNDSKYWKLSLSILLLTDCSLIMWNCIWNCKFCFSDTFFHSFSLSYSLNTAVWIKKSLFLPGNFFLNYQWLQNHQRYLLYLFLCKLLLFLIFLLDFVQNSGKLQNW